MTRLRSSATRHGTVTGYKYHGCRCAPCRSAVVTYEKRRKLDVARHGPRKVSSKPLLRLLAYARSCGMTPLEISAVAGVGKTVVWRVMNGQAPYLLRPTLDQIIKGVDKLLAQYQQRLDEQQQALNDLRSALDYIQGRERLRRMDPAPLRDALANLSLLQDAERRQVYRQSVSERFVEDVCSRFDLDPSELYGDAWLDLEEVV